MKCQWLLLAVIAAVAMATAVEGRVLKMRPMTATEVYLALSSAGRENAIPEDRYVTDGIAVGMGQSRAVEQDHGQTKDMPRRKKSKKTRQRQSTNTQLGKSISVNWGNTNGNGVTEKPPTLITEPYQPQEFVDYNDPNYNPYNQMYSMPNFYMPSGYGSAGQPSTTERPSTTEPPGLLGQHDWSFMNSIYNLKMNALSNLFGPAQQIDSGPDVHFEPEEICFTVETQPYPYPTQPYPTTPTTSTPYRRRSRVRKASRGRERRRGRQFAFHPQEENNDGEKPEGEESQEQNMAPTGPVDYQHGHHGHHGHYGGNYQYPHSVIEIEKPEGEESQEQNAAPTGPVDYHHGHHGHDGHDGHHNHHGGNYQYPHSVMGENSEEDDNDEPDLDNQFSNAVTAGYPSNGPDPIVTGPGTVPTNGQIICVIVQKPVITASSSRSRH